MIGSDRNKGQVFKEVTVPSRMIYIKETFDTYKETWPLTFNTQPPNFTFIKHSQDEID